MKEETPEDVCRWFLEEVKRLLPVAKGSLGISKNKCVYKNCRICKTGKKHTFHRLYIGVKGKRTNIYIPKDMVGMVEEAIQNGRKLEHLMVEAGIRWVKALKRKRQSVSNITNKTTKRG